MRNHHIVWYLSARNEEKFKFSCVPLQSACVNVSLYVRGSEYWLCLMVEHFFSTRKSAHISNFISEIYQQLFIFQIDYSWWEIALW